MAKSETMTIAFPNGGILPSDITGGKERHVAAHEAVDVPVRYGEQLVTDRFAYQSKPAKKGKEDAAIVAARKKLEDQLPGLRDSVIQEADPARRARLTDKIADIQKQLEGMPGGFAQAD